MTVDLSTGRLALATPTVSRAVAVPAEWLAQAVAALGANAGPLAASLAAAVAADARAMLAGDADPSPEACASAVALALAQRGLGTCSFGRFGDALTLTWSAPPSAEPAFHAFASDLVAAVVSAVTGLATHAAVAGHAGDTLTLFLGSEPACTFVRERAARGEGSASILATLLGATSA